MPRFAGTPIEETPSPRFGGQELTFGRDSKKQRVKTSTERLVEEGKLPAVLHIPVEAAEQALRAARQGLTFGFSDELAGLGAGAKALLTGEDAGAAYRAERDRERALSRQFAEDYPTANVLGQLGGGFLTGAAPAKAVTQAPNILRQIVRAVPTGAAFGGLAGAGTSEAEDVAGVASDAGRGALVGGIVAPVIPAVASAVSGASGVARRIAGRMAPPRSPVPASTTATATAPAGQAPPINPRERALDIVGQTVQRSGRTLDELEQAVADAEALGAKPEVLADLLGDRGARQLYSSRTLGGEGTSKALERLSERGEGTAARVSEDVQQAIAQRGQSLAQLDARIENRRRTGNTLYQEAFKHGEVTNPDTLALVQNPRVSGILKQAEDRSALAADLNNTPFTRLFADGPNGPILTRAPTVQDLHRLKTSLDDDIQKAFRDGNGEVGKALRDFKNKIVSNLEDEVPAYRKARETYKGDREIEDAITNARADILRKPVDELRRDFAALSPAEQDAYRIGAVDQILSQKVDRGVDSADVARKLWGNADTRNRLALIVRGPDELTKLVKQFQREQAIARTNRGVFGGSNTALREFDLGDQVAGAVADAATQGVRGAAVSQIQRIIRRSGGITEAVADDIARILTTEGPENLRAVIGSLKGREQARVIQALNRQRAARAAGGTSAQQTNGNP